MTLPDTERLNSLKHQLHVVGHRAYSYKKLDSKRAVRAFERLEEIKEEIKKLEARMYGQPVLTGELHVCKTCMPYGLKSDGVYKHKGACFICGEVKKCVLVDIPFGVPLRVMRLLLSLGQTVQRGLDLLDSPNSQHEIEGKKQIAKVDALFSPKGLS